MSEPNLLEAARRFVALWDHPVREPGLAAWHAAVDYAYEELKKAVAACAPDSSREQEATDQTALDLDEMLARIEAAVAEGRLLSKDGVAFLEEMVRLAESAPVVPSAFEELWEKEEADRVASTGITPALAGEEPQPANLEPLLDDAWEQRVVERHRGIAERDSISKENTGHLETMANLLDLIGEKVGDASDYIRHELTKRMKGDRDADAADRP